MFGLVMGEASLIAAGLGYKKDKDNVQYDTVKSMCIKKFACATEISELSNNWNVQVHLWLKYYVMLRLMDRKKPRGQF